MWVIMKIVTVVGARPQFVKAAVVSRAMSEHNARHPGALEELIVHTGQHFDHNMSQAFFDDLSLPTPSHHLGIHGGGHGQMTGRMLEGLESVFQRERPDWVLIYGDTNSTLAGALAATKLHIPVAHVEAGLRSFNMRMPEEVNRILADRVSSLLLCPTELAVQNLSREGIVHGVEQIGDVMYDAALFYSEITSRRSESALVRHNVKRGEYALATCHRAENTDDSKRLREILAGLSEVGAEMPVILPLHPRTAAVIRDTGLSLPEGVRGCEAVAFLDMVELERNAALILTDSGGVQKEAYFYGVPCITMRDETEWVETVDAGWNILSGASRERIGDAARGFRHTRPAHRPLLYGDGHAGRRVVEALVGFSPVACS
jgi:UDP-GlcNAc3NAcA epimerase